LRKNPSLKERRTESGFQKVEGESTISGGERCIFTWPIHALGFRSDANSLRDVMMRIYLNADGIPAAFARRGKVGRFDQMRQINEHISSYFIET
jgi:hypothetical protein